MPTLLQILIVLTALLGGLGVFFMLPRGANTRRFLGMALAGAALVPLWVIWIMNFRDAGPGAGTLFCLLASITVAGGVMTITQRNPVASALWFTLVVIGTAGLFMLANAQFLAAAIVVVYAGAIIVMFLFVVMMAQQYGTAIYDQIAREPAFAVVSGFVLLFALISAVVATYGGSAPLRADSTPLYGSAVLSHRPGDSQVAQLGRALLVEHWLSLEVAGTMLLVAMVGAILISAKSAVRRVVQTPVSGDGIGAGTDQSVQPVQPGGRS